MGSRRPYKLDSTALGMGGFGVVHRAVSRDTGEVVALKKALPTTQALRRIKREIEVQRSLTHDHIMPILDADPRGRWFTMPLASETFGMRYARVRPSNLGLAQILLDVAAGLQYAHYRGHVHRDVTPSNILRIDHGTAGDRWVVADWGLVQPPIGQESLPLTLTGQVLGTRSFGPPELMVAPHGVGPEVDVYYIGALAAWALSGEEPSPGNMPVPDDASWAVLVRQATQTDPHDRPQSMITLLGQLHTMRDGFATAQAVASQTQQVLFPEHPCGVCGAEVTEMRCTRCGAYYATYN